MPPPSSPSPVERRRRQPRWILPTALGVLLGMVGIAIWRMMSTPAPIAATLPVVQPADPQPLPPPSPAAKPLVDESKLLWESPTAGEPISLAGLPPGTPLILLVRPAELAKSAEGERVLAALGPGGSAQLKHLQQVTGLAFADLDELLIGVRPGSEMPLLDVTLVVTPRTALNKLPIEGTIAKYAEKKYTVADGWGYWRRGARWIIAAPETLHEIIDADAEPPLLRRGMERLLERSDAKRSVTLLAAPNFLFAEGEAVWAGPLSALRTAVFEELPDELQGLLLSLQVGERCYIELRGESAAELSPARLAALLKQQAEGWANQVQLALLEQVPARHSREVVARLPAMLQVLAGRLRKGVEDEQAVVNAYLPGAASHNFTLAGELLLSERAAGKTSPPPAAPASPRTLAEKLQAPVTVTFDRDTLEMAVKYLAEELGAPIEILGSDLQLEGITKNQSFGLAIENRPAAEALWEICQRANPDKDSQKLVYVVREDKIVITTRAAAAKRGEKLPEVFEDKLTD